MGAAREMEFPQVESKKKEKFLFFCRKMGLKIQQQGGKKFRKKNNKTLRGDEGMTDKRKTFLLLLPAWLKVKVQSFSEIKFERVEIGNLFII